MSTLKVDRLEPVSFSQIELVGGVSLASTASYVEFDNVDGLTSFSSSVATTIDNLSFTLNVAGDSGTDGVNLKNDTLSFQGTSNEILTTVTDNTVTLGLPSNVTVQNDLIVGGTLRAEEFITTTVSSSVVFQSGSTQFGDTLDDTHTFTGSLAITGSVTATAFLGDGSQLSGISTTPFPFTGSAGISGSLSVDGTATVTTLVETSTRDLKRNIKTLTSQLDKISLLNPVQFNWVGSDEVNYGFVADEVAEVYPEFTDEKASGVQYSKMVSILSKGIQDLYNLVKIQEERIKELENK